MITKDPMDLTCEELLSNDAPRCKLVFPYGEVFHGEGFFNYLNKADKTTLWIISYSVSPFCPVEIPIDRLIYSVGNSSLQGYSLSKKTKILHKLHTKLYIQRLKSRTVGVYIGSLNLVTPSYQDVMIKVPKTNWKFFVEYFNYYWNLPTKQTPTP